MIGIIKADIRKVLSLRWTYISVAIGFLFIIFMSFYVEGFKHLGVAEAHPYQVRNLAFNILGVTAMLGMIVGVMLMINEYRYNTITYAFTASNSRLKVLASKLLVSAVFAVLIGLGGLGIGILSFYLGNAIGGYHASPTQYFDVVNVLGRYLYYCVAYTWFALIIGTLVRNVVFTILTVFVVPITVEPLLGLLLKHNAVYLPFSLLTQIVGSGEGGLTQGTTTPAKAMVIFSCYLLGGWLITGWLFRRRDAN